MPDACRAAPADLSHRPHDIVPRWVLERAHDALAAADTIARALRESDADAYALVEVHRG